jgi:hypothetical protein
MELQDRQSPITSEADLEHEYVHKVYKEIALHFNSTRWCQWPKVKNFVKSFPKGRFF